MKKQWIYCGDINPENGGYWFNPEELQYDYVAAIRVQPMVDAGGPDNQFWVEYLTVNIPTAGAKRKQALDCIGQGDAELPKGATGRNILVDACIAYGFYDIDETRTVRVGPQANYSSGFDPVVCEIVLRAGSRLKNWVRREFMQGK